jgi:hypothetical protein
MIDDILDFAGNEAKIQRHHGDAEQGRRLIEFEIPAAVLEQQRDPVAGINAEFCEGIRQTANARP